MHIKLTSPVAVPLPDYVEYYNEVRPIKYVNYPEKGNEVPRLADRGIFDLLINKLFG